jgi:hypothetical protein
VKRKLFIAGTISSALAACPPIGTALNQKERFQNMLKNGKVVSSTLIGTHGLAYRMLVDGTVENRHVFTLGEWQAMNQAIQTTRHDCVEGWSAIGKWSGVPLRDLLAKVKPRSDARFVVFHCMDKDDQNTPYYESLDLHQASHPQAPLALRLNDAPLDPDHGAPVRLRVPTQLDTRAQSGSAASNSSAVSPTSTRATGATGKTRATSGTRAFRRGAPNCPSELRYKSVLYTTIS